MAINSKILSVVAKKRRRRSNFTINLNTYVYELQVLGMEDARANLRSRT